MPGFKIADNQADQLALPKSVVYSYTWTVPEIFGSKGIDNIYLKEATLPSYTYAVEEIETGHTTYPIAKGVKWADVKLTFYDTEGLGDVLGIGLPTVWTRDLGLRPASEYMGISRINVTHSDGTPAYNWRLVNSWIKSISYAKLTYETSGINTVEVTLAYSWAEYYEGNGDRPASQPPEYEEPSARPYLPPQNPHGVGLIPPSDTGAAHPGKTWSETARAWKPTTDRDRELADKAFQKRIAKLRKDNKGNTKADTALDWRDNPFVSP